MAAYGYETGNAVVRDGYADAVAFAAPFIADPDLVERFSGNLELGSSNPDTYYGGGAEGYVDYEGGPEQAAV